MPPVLQRPLNPCVAPTRILGGHERHEAPNFCDDGRSPRSPPRVGPFPRNQFTMPSKNCISRDARRHLARAVRPSRCPSIARRHHGASFNCSRGPGSWASAPDSLLEETRSHRSARARAIRVAQRGACAMESRRQFTANVLPEFSDTTGAIRLASWSRRPRCGRSPCTHTRSTATGTMNCDRGQRDHSI
jgi:hypothetical protein